MLESVISAVTSRLERCSALLKDRGEKYAVPEQNIIRTATMATAVLGFTVKPSHVCFILACMKISRANQTPGDRDHGDDGVNYLAMAFEFKSRGE